jgi:hypothetical protein
MRWNRNKCLAIGVLLLLLGGQARLVDKVVFNQEASNYLAKQQGAQQQGPTGVATRFAAKQGVIPLQQMVIPSWLGLALLSTGAVLVLQALVMPKPGEGAPAG